MHACPFSLFYLWYQKTRSVNARLKITTRTYKGVLKQDMSQDSGCTYEIKWNRHTDNAYSNAFNEIETKYKNIYIYIYMLIRRLLPFLNPFSLSKISNVIALFRMKASFLIIKIFQKNLNLHKERLCPQTFSTWRFIWGEVRRSRRSFNLISMAIVLRLTKVISISWKYSENFPTLCKGVEFYQCVTKIGWKLFGVLQAYHMS